MYLLVRCSCGREEVFLLLLPCVNVDSRAESLDWFRPPMARDPSCTNWETLTTLLSQIPFPFPLWPLSPRHLMPNYQAPHTPRLPSRSRSRSRSRSLSLPPIALHVKGICLHLSPPAKTRDVVPNGPITACPKLQLAAAVVRHLRL
jgi:hypothetical protein